MQTSAPLWRSCWESNPPPKDSPFYRQISQVGKSSVEMLCQTQSRFAQWQEFCCTVLSSCHAIKVFCFGGKYTFTFNILVRYAFCLRLSGIRPQPIDSRKWDTHTPGHHSLLVHVSLVPVKDFSSQKPSQAEFHEVYQREVLLVDHLEHLTSWHCEEHKTQETCETYHTIWSATQVMLESSSLHCTLNFWNHDCYIPLTQCIIKVLGVTLLVVYAREKNSFNSCSQKQKFEWSSSKIKASDKQTQRKLHNL